LLPVKGGKTPYLQEQNWPLDILAGRPPPVKTPPPQLTPPPNPPPDETPPTPKEWIADVDRVLALARLY
jgi:hypothetical protein